MACDPVTPPFQRTVCSCNQPSNVKLDPTTKAGASCNRCGYPPSLPGRAEVELYEVAQASLPE